MSTLNDTPLVSVIVPVYNVEQYIDDCLNSIRQQSYSNLEIIIVEDCSTDNSDAAIKPHLEDKRVKVIYHEVNSGLSAARNTGIDAATGEFIMFVDSDDLVAPILIESCIEGMKQTNADVITYECTPFNDGQDFSKSLSPTSKVKNSISLDYLGNEFFNKPHFAWLKFIRTKIIKTNEISFPVGLYYEDWPFHWHLGLSTKNIYHMPISFYLYRQRNTSITGSTGSKLLDLFEVQKQVFELVDRYEVDNVKSILSNKIKLSHWSILSRIDSEYLDIAFKKAKYMDQALHVNSKKLTNSNFKSSLVNFIVRQPDSMGILTLRTLRKTLKFRKRLLNNNSAHDKKTKKSVKAKA